MKNMKKIGLTVMILILGSAFLFAGGGQQSSGSTGGNASPSAPVVPAALVNSGITQNTSTSKKVRVVAGSFADVGVLDPYDSAGASVCYKTVVYEYLGIRNGLGGPLQLVLAKKTDKVDDFTFDIEIYDYIYDSKGNHITADDIVYCYDYMRRSGRVSKMGNLKSMTKTGDYTLRMILTNSSVGVYEDMMQRPIVSKKEYEAARENFTGEGYGTGPYAISNYVAGSSITIKKRADYWQKDPSLIPRSQWANVEELQIQFIGSTSQLAIAMQTGQIDGILYMSGSDSAYFVDTAGKVAAGYNVVVYQDNNTFQFLVNMESSKLLSKNKDLREALFKSIDPNGLIDGTLGGRGSVAHDYGNNSFPDYETSWDREDYFSYDENAARALVRSSGYKGEELVFSTYNTTPYKEIAELVQAYAGIAGINIKIYPIETSQVNTILNDPKLYDIFMITTNASDYIVNCWAYLLDARNWNGATRNMYKDEKLQSLLETAMSVEGHTPANIRAYHDYLKNTGTVRGVIVQNFYSIWTENVKDVYRNRNGYAMPTAFIYSDNWKRLVN
jgi:ABC-type transport system substrate-binding protein